MAFEIPAALVDRIRAEAARLGFSRLGIAPATPPPHHDAFRAWLATGLAGATHEWLARHATLRADPRSLLPGATTIVMLATDHVADVPESAGPQGRVARYAWGDDYHDLLRARGNALAAWLEAAVPGCATRAVVDSAPLAERDFAALAGLGWIGKNTMLIHPGAGSYFLLTALLTDLALPIDAPLDVDHCGTCTACLDACPTQAFPEPRVLDARRCISALTIEDHGHIAPELRPAMADWIFGCDVCQEVCPWNRHAPGSLEPAFQPRGGAAALDPGDLLHLDAAGFRDRFRGSAIRRAKRRGLLRSAAHALGNRPDAGRLDVLTLALDDEEPVIRAAAAWALGRWVAAGVAVDAARAALGGRRAVETDPEVRAEIVAALA